MTRHYVTACRANELPVLLASMERQCAPFLLHVLAWDWPFPSYVPAHARIVSRSTFLARNPEFSPHRLPPPARTVINQVCTARWRFLADVIADTGQPATLIDGDLWFFGDPAPVFEEIGSAAIAVTPHGFAPASAVLPGVTLESHAKYGAFNSGFTYIADPAIAAALADLNWEWSHTDFRTMPDGRVVFGDQGYLQLVAESEAVGAHVIASPVNIGPWSVHAQPLRQTHDGAVFFGGRPLIAYHYSSFRPGPGGQLADPAYAVTTEQGRILYEPYRAALAATAR